MSTIGYQLNILRDTQMVQRRLLEKQFPYIDWEKMPFSSYGDFFRLRGILDDCGAVWTNAYGRSNTEADGQRNFLKDYSGNGRDIELFNFGYSIQSGFNGYVQDFRNLNLGANITNSTITESKIILTNTNIDEAIESVGSIPKAKYINKGFRIKVSSLSSWAVIIFYTSDYTSSVKKVNLKEGILDIPALTDEEWSSFGFFSINIPNDGSVVIEQLPSYPGALVGDGVDDYGQCVKDFALPDDYTVVAMREILTPNSCLASKIQDAQNGAFCMELFGNSTISYGTVNNSVPPKLFSFQTRVSYNGSSINSGTSGDGNTNKLMLFKRPLDTPCSSVALYSFGIFTRTLTEDELRIVENCMYAEWIAMTGKLEDIEYYDILDARFRSNDEAADKRDKWAGRFGRLHMTLHNYGYSQMSGWDGYKDSIIYGMTPNFSGIAPATKTGNTIRWIYPYTSDIYLLGTGGRDEFKFTVYIKGVTRAISSGILQEIRFRTRMRTATQIDTVPIKKDGVYNISLPVTSETVYLGVVSQPLKQENFPEPIIITQIPDYPGALVSDGVDDYAVSDEVIDEAIGGVVCHVEKPDIQGVAHYAYGSPAGGVGSSMAVGTLAAYFTSDLFKMGNSPVINHDIQVPYVYGYSREPAVPNYTLYIQRAQATYGVAALYQLRLIKTQPTDIQLEAIKWQCRKEHDDYLIHMGWKEVE